MYLFIVIVAVLMSVVIHSLFRYNSGVPSGSAMRRRKRAGWARRPQCYMRLRLGAVSIATYS